jgi:hypothetical protein
MTNVMASLIVDIKLSNENLTLFGDGNWFLIAATANEYYQRSLML